jgi:hypothetical protein
MKHYTMKAYAESIYRSTFSCTWQFVGGEWSVSRPGRFTPGERVPGTHRRLMFCHYWIKMHHSAIEGVFFWNCRSISQEVVKTNVKEIIALSYALIYYSFLPSELYYISVKYWYFVYSIFLISSPVQNLSHFKQIESVENGFTVHKS